MRRRTLFFIAAEGWAVLCALALLLAAADALAGVPAALLLLLLMVMAAVYFRDLPRDVPAEPLAVIAPADGRIVHRRECYDPYLDREAIRVSLQLDWFGNYLLRSPAEGTVLALADAAAAAPAGVVSRIRTDEGDDLVVAVARGSLFGARPCCSNFGERVGQGRCCGRRRLARRLDLYLPQHARVEVELGAHVRAGTCVLAKLVHRPRATAPAIEPARRPVAVPAA